MTYKIIFISLLIVMLAVGVSMSRADDTLITTCDFNTLQTAIQTANEGVIQMDCEGTILFPRQISITGDVHLIGNEALILDGGGQTRLFYVADGVSLTIETLTIQNGYSTEFGGAMLNDGGSLTIHKVLFTRNRAESGGAIYNGGALTITDSHFMRNSGEFGGVIYNDEADTSITNTYFFENEGLYGAVVYNEDGNVILSSSKLLENDVSYYYLGSLLFNTEDSLIDIRSSDIYAKWSNDTNVANKQGTFISQDTHYEVVNCIEGTITDNGGNTSDDSNGCPGDAPTTPADVVVTDCDHFWGSGTLLEAVIIANKAGGTITFACSGTIHFLHEWEIRQDITINGGGNIIFDGDGKTPLIKIHYSSSTVYFEGLTFQNADNPLGYGYSAIYSMGWDDLTVSNCIFINNHFAISHSSNTLTVHNSIFTDNYGGAIFTDGDMVTITNSTFTNNTGRFGAIYMGDVTLVDTKDTFSASITNSTFTNNSAEVDGGAILMGISVYLTLTDSTFTGNTAGENGGAIYMRGAFITIQNSTFTDNTAGISGGAIFHELDRWVDGAVTSENAVYTNNTCVSAVSITDLGGNIAENADGCPNS